MSAKVQKEKLRVLHVLGTLSRGGTESWLMALLRELVPSKDLEFQIAIQEEPTPSSYAAEADELDVPVHTLRRDIGWPLRLYRLLRSGGFDVVHSHRNEFSAIVLLIAWIARVPIRIAHSHSDSTRSESLPHRFYRLSSSVMLWFVATRRIAVSKSAQNSLFSIQMNTSDVVYCGLDLSGYAFNPESRSRVRDELGISANAPVLVHVGNLRPVKNHLFLLEVFAEFVHAYEHDANMILVGEGTLQSAIVKRSTELDIQDSIHLVGSRSNVTDYLSASDVFVFPSLYEGLGLAVVEAQASGLPVVESDTVPIESVVDPDRVRRLGLHQSTTEWASSIHEFLVADFDRNCCHENLLHFEIKQNAVEMRKLYKRN